MSQIDVSGKGKEKSLLKQLNNCLFVAGIKKNKKQNKNVVKALTMCGKLRSKVVFLWNFNNPELHITFQDSSCDSVLTCADSIYSGENPF